MIVFRGQQRISKQEILPDAVHGNADVSAGKDLLS
jgi:hypothetical protein